MLRTKTIRTIPDLEQLVEDYLAFDEFTFDVETVGTRPSRDIPGPDGKLKGKPKDIPALDPMTNKVFWISLGGPNRFDAIPMGHPQPDIFGREVEQLTRAQVFKHLEPLFFSDRRKVNHNVKFDLLSIAKYYDDTVPPPPYGCTIALTHLLNENWDKRGGYGLENLSKAYIGYEYIEKLGGLTAEVDFERAARYSAVDARTAWLIWSKLYKILEKPDLSKLRALFDKEMEVLEALLEAYLHGAYVRKQGFFELKDKLAIDLPASEEKIFAITGERMNLRSPKQKAEYLYDKVGLTPVRFTKTGQRSTDAQALADLAAYHPAARAMMAHSDLEKLNSSFVYGLIPFIGGDGRIRADLNQSGTVTGRFSCSKPNLQQIPIRAKEGFDAMIIRQQFTAPKGRTLVVGDFSQIELRVLAHQTRDKMLLKAYLENIDLHALTASHVYGIDIEEVDKEQRALGKMSNFNLAFEGGPNRIREAVLKEGGSMSKKEAKRVYDQWHRTYPGVKRWGTKVKNLCFDQGYVEDLLGRRHRLPGIRSSDQGLRGYNERQAVNFPIQGSAGSIAKLAMVDIYRAFCDNDLDAAIVIQVHDEFIVEAREDEAEDVRAIMIECMEGVQINGGPALDVPLVADVNIGKTWATAK